MRDHVKEYGFKQWLSLYKKNKIIVWKYKTNNEINLKHKIERPIKT